MKSRFSASDNGNAEIKKAQINKTAIVLTNLGSPDEPKAKALKVYLREFLSDPRVVEIPRLIWLFILNGIILNIRPKKSAKLYEKVWLEDGSPLVSMAESQTKKIADLIAQRFPDTEKQTYHVEVAMRYGNPSIKDVLTKLQNDNINDIILLPLYPQYASPTTGSTFDALSKVLQKWRYVPNVQFINGYHTNSTYIKALASSIREHVEMVGKPDKLVLSYHGMPELFRKNGDPYYEFCEQTTTLVKHELLNHAEGFALAAEDFVMTFQSRFGNAQWLTPYTDVTLEELAKQGHKNIAIISPAFSADCLETLEELEDENREIFMDAGGETYHYIPALNDRDDHIEAILDVLTPAIKSMAK